MESHISILEKLIEQHENKKYISMSPTFDKKYLLWRFSKSKVLFINEEATKYTFHSIEEDLGFKKHMKSQPLYTHYWDKFYWKNLREFTEEFCLPKYPHNLISEENQVFFFLCFKLFFINPHVYFNFVKFYEPKFRFELVDKLTNTKTSSSLSEIKTCDFSTMNYRYLWNKELSTISTYDKSLYSELEIEVHKQYYRNILESDEVNKSNLGPEYYEHMYLFFDCRLDYDKYYNLIFESRRKPVKPIEV